MRIYFALHKVKMWGESTRREIKILWIPSIFPFMGTSCVEWWTRRLSCRDEGADARSPGTKPIILPHIPSKNYMAVRCECRVSIFSSSQILTFYETRLTQPSQKILDTLSIPHFKAFQVAPSRLGVKYTDWIPSKGTPHAMSVLDMPLNNLIVSLQLCLNFGECGVPLHCHRSKVHSDPD